MSKKNIYLDGKSTEIVIEKIHLNKLVLDIENPRIQYYLDTRLHDEVTQEKIKFALAEGNEQYSKLKDHIEKNGGIYNPIWIVPYKKGYFLVIEGNSRAYAYEELSEKYVNDEKWKSIDAYILPEKVEKHKINFIRLESHLFGKTPWDAYEKARELYRLHNEEDYSLKRLKDLTKMSIGDIQNNIHAYKYMEEQYLTKYKKPIERLKFSYFVEFWKNKEIKKLIREGKLNPLDFCDWVGGGKFRRGEDVRKLPYVLKDDYAREALINENFQAALDQLELTNPKIKSKLFEKIEDVIDGLERMPAGEIHEIKYGFQQGKLDALRRLHQKVTEFLDLIQAP
jgi:hypothetical protein